MPVYYPVGTATANVYVWVTSSVAQTAIVNATGWPVYQTTSSVTSPPYGQPPWIEREQIAAEHARCAAANQRATELLLEHLTPEQRETFEKNKWFVVEGGNSKTQYRINENDGCTVANIDVLVDKGSRVQSRLCGHIQYGRVPHADQLLAQKMMIEFDEDAFLRIANRHPA